MDKNKVFLFFISSFLAGVFASNILMFFGYITIFLGFILLYLFCVLVLVKRYQLFLLIISIGVTFGALYGGIYNSFVLQKEAFISQFYSQERHITGVVKEFYKSSSKNDSYIISLSSFDEIQISGIDALIYLSSPDILEVGDVISFDGKIQEIENFSSGFSYKRFLETRNVYTHFFINRVEKIGYVPPPKWKQVILSIESKLTTKISQMFPKEEAGFLGGILLGARYMMGDEMLEHFNNAGITHFVSVSGFHVTVVIIFLGFLLKFLPVVPRSIIICGAVVFFVLLVGAGIPAIRGGLMGIVGYIILLGGRKGDSLSLLLLTAFLLIVYNPLILNYESSFHLSFLAVVGLLYFQKFWEKVFFFLPNFLSMRDSFVLTMSALTTTIPIMVFSFERITFFAPVANMLVGGLVPFAMLFGFVSLIASRIWAPIGYIVGYVTYAILHYIVWVAHFFGGMDISVYEISFGRFAPYLQLGYLMLLFFIILSYQLRDEKIPLPEVKEEV